MKKGFFKNLNKWTSYSPCQITNSGLRWRRRLCPKDIPQRAVMLCFFPCTWPHCPRDCRSTCNGCFVLQTCWCSQRVKKCSSSDDDCENSVLLDFCLCQMLEISPDLRGAGKPAREWQHISSGKHKQCLMWVFILFSHCVLPSHEKASYQHYKQPQHVHVREIWGSSSKMK